MSGSDKVTSKNGVAIGTNYGDVHLTHTPSDAEIKNQEHAYLRFLSQDCGGLEWLRSIRDKDSQTPAVTLDAIYTGLLTTSRENEAVQHPKKDKQARQLSAVEVLNQHPHLVLTGAPGGGKSAFVNFLTLCLAGEQLKVEQPNLKTLTEPLPDEGGEPQEDRQPWDHKNLIPVRVILRDFASSAKHFPKKGTMGEAKHLMGFIEDVLQNKEHDDYFPILKKRMLDGDALIMLDGLDEVPEAGESRERMVSCIHNFKKSFATCRILVTCRPYAYENAEWQIPDFTETRLADFNRGQIIRFIDSWYATRNGFDETAKQEYAKGLKHAIFAKGREALHQLVERPLLLTMTAYLHAYSGQELPEQRAGLYEELLKLLIDKWEAARFEGKDDATRRLLQPALSEYLHIGSSQIRSVLEKLAFNAHATQEKTKGTADIPVDTITTELYHLVKEKGCENLDSIDNLRTYLSERVGILYQRGGDSERDAIYTFPHRSFQEYLAACYFGKGKELYALFRDKGRFRRWYELAAYLAKTDPDRWREVVLLAAGINDQEAVVDLIDALYPDPENNDSLTIQQAWGLRFAGEILAENLERDELSEWDMEIANRVIKTLPKLLHSQLSAEERVATGQYLAKVGDPRKEVMDVDAIQLCYVSAGKFFLGGKDQSDDSSIWLDNLKEANDYTIKKDYWLAQYPVTVAQFQQFVEENSDFKPENKNCLEGLANTPVVYVSWDEAIRFCDWLNKRWQQQGWLPEGYHVTLPSEPEWEMAAKGGYQIPQHANPVSISALVESQNELKDNPLSKRYYPWGDEEDANRMNYAMKIGTVSAVGAYANGRSPYGCEELSGNVLEWTRSKKGDYPYPEDVKGRQELENLMDSVGRVLRGGAFYDDQWFVRCSYRFSSHPGSRLDLIGFRVAVSPLL